jgi:hypothetical protein
MNFKNYFTFSVFLKGQFCSLNIICFKTIDGIHHSEDLSIDGKITLKLFLKNMVENYVLVSSGSG